VVSERGFRVALFLRELVQQAIRVHHRLGVLILAAGIGDHAQGELPGRRRLTLVLVGARQPGIVFGDQPSIARGAGLVVIAAQQLDRVGVAPLVDVETGEIDADQVCPQHLADFAAGRDGVDERRHHVGCQPAAAIERLETQLTAAAHCADRSIFGGGAVRIAQAQVVLANLVVEIADDQQTLLARVLVRDFGQQPQQPTELRECFVVVRAQSLRIGDRSAGTEAQRDVARLLDDLLQRRNSPRVVAGVGAAPAFEVLQELLLRRREGRGLLVELAHQRAELGRIDTLDLVSPPQQLICFLRGEGERSAGEQRAQQRDSARRETPGGMPSARIQSLPLHGAFLRGARSSDERFCRLPRLLPLPRLRRARQGPASHQTAHIRLCSEQLAEAQRIVAEQRAAQLGIDASGGDCSFQLRGRGVTESGVATELVQELDDIQHLVFSFDVGGPAGPATMTRLRGNCSRGQPSSAQKLGRGGRRRPPGVAIGGPAPHVRSPVLRQNP
jgi:hypothetical protein